FLILFVFAMFTTGINRLKTEVEKKENLEYQLGKIPEEIRKKNIEDLKSVQDSVSSLAEKREILKKSLDELSGLTDTLQEKEDALKQLYQDQMQKTAM